MPDVHLKLGWFKRDVDRAVEQAKCYKMVGSLNARPTRPATAKEKSE